MKVELEVPRKYEGLLKGLDVKSVIEKSLRQALVSEFRSQLFLNLLREVSYKPKRISKISLKEFPKGRLNKKALQKISEEIKEDMAKRHGL
jgi:hypothetical protein